MRWCFPWMQKTEDNLVSLFSSRKADCSLPFLQGGETEGESCIEGKGINYGEADKIHPDGRS